MLRERTEQELLRFHYFVRHFALLFSCFWLRSEILRLQSWNDDVPAYLFQRRVLALQIVGHSANVVIAGTPHVVTHVQVATDAPHATPGQVLA